MARFPTFLSAVLLLVLGAPSAHAQSDVAGVGRVLQSLDSTFNSMGFVLRGRHVAPLQSGGTLSTPVTAQEGRQYVIVALCDSNCQRPQLEARSSAGQVLLRGTANGPFAQLRFNAEGDGSFELVRRMESCRAAECAIGHHLYERRHVEEISVCILQDHALTEIAAMRDPWEGDTIMQGRPFHEVYRPAASTYAGEATWLRAGEPVEFGGHRYRRYGLPRVYGVDELERAGEYRGFDVFVEPEVANRIYVPIRMGCEFQPYERVP